MFLFSRQKNSVNNKFYFSIISMYLIIYLQKITNNMYVRIYYSKNKNIQKKILFNFIQFFNFYF